MQTIKTNLPLLLPSITLALLVLASSGCRSASSASIGEKSRRVGLELSPGTVVRVRMPEQGRYRPTLFQKPIVVRSKDAPSNWTGQWLESEEAQNIMQMGPCGVAAVPMIVASGVHTFFGTAIYKALPTTSDYSREAMMSEVDAMAAAAHERQFEPDLKLAVLDELRKQGVVTVDAADFSATPDAPASPIVTIDLYIVTVGMTSGGFSNRTPNPVQTFHLDVRAEVMGAEGRLATLRLKFDSNRARFREWAADDASRLAAIRHESLRTVAAQLAGRLKSASFGEAVSRETHLAAGR